MITFQYVVVDDKGKEQKGCIDAESAKEASLILRGRSLFVLSITEGGSSGSGVDFSILKKLNPRLYLRVGKWHLVMMFRQWSLMLKAGHTLLESLESVSKLITHPRLQLILKQLVVDIQSGSSFSNALGKHKAVFSTFVVNLVASGEASGELDKIMQRIADDMERKMEVQREVITSMIYPMIILITSLGVIAFLMLGVIPKMADMLEGKGVAVPENTMRMIELSEFFQENIKMIGIVAGVSIFSVLASYTTQRGKVIIDRLLLYVPIIGPTILYSTMAQLGWTLSMLVRSGLTVLDALNITSQVVENETYKRCLQRSSERILSGDSLSVALQEKIMPPLLCHMAEVGEKTGQIDVVMNEVGVYYHKNLQARIKRMTAMIEPALILFVGVSVFFVMAAFFSALFAASTGGK